VAQAAVLPLDGREEWQCPRAERRTAEELGQRCCPCLEAQAMVGCTGLGVTGTGAQAAAQMGTMWNVSFPSAAWRHADSRTAWFCLPI